MFDDFEARVSELAGRPGPVLASVEGRAGLDPLPALLRAIPPSRRIVFLSPGLTDPENLEVFLEAVSGFLDEPDPVPTGWSGALEALARRAPITVVVGGARSLAVANRKLWKSWGESWNKIRRTGARFHLFLVDDQYKLGASLNAADSPFRNPAARLGGPPEPDPVETLRIGPASHYDLGAAAPTWNGMDLLVAWSLLGGSPNNWGAFPGSSSPLRAARDLYLGGGQGPPPPDQLLARYVQAPNRYASILSAIAQGARSWREVSSRVGEASSTRSASGPYLQRLGDLGLIAVDKPVGAPAKARRSRYRLTDPQEVFWWARFHPLRSALASAPDPQELWREQLQPFLRPHVMAVLPQILLAFLRRGAEPLLGSVAREVGPLWGEGFDLPAAATLHSGGICYAQIHKGAGAADLPMLSELEQQIKEARYGFGRQARIRLLVSITGFSEALKREAARNSLVRLLGVAELTEPLEATA